MANPNKHYDFTTKKTWVPFSSFGTKFQKLNTRPVHKWKKYLQDIEVKSIEFLCKNEMKSMRYKFKFSFEKNRSKQVMSFIRKNYNKEVNWRTDLNNFKEDKKIELFRLKILEKKIFPTKLLLKKCFLFQNFYLNNLIKHYQSQ